MYIHPYATEYKATAAGVSYTFREVGPSAWTITAAKVGERAMPALWKSPIAGGWEFTKTANELAFATIEIAAAHVSHNPATWN